MDMDMVTIAMVIPSFERTLACCNIIDSDGELD
jgi:hypothetical protein